MPTDPLPYCKPYTYRSTKTGRTYTLHARECVSRNGNPITLFYFASKPDLAHALARIPAGYEIGEGWNGLPHLRRAAQNEDGPKPRSFLHGLAMRVGLHARA